MIKIGIASMILQQGVEGRRSRTATTRWTVRTAWISALMGRRRRALHWVALRWATGAAITVGWGVTADALWRRWWITAGYASI